MTAAMSPAPGPGRGRAQAPASRPVATSTPAAEVTPWRPSAGEAQVAPDPGEGRRMSERRRTRAARSRSLASSMTRLAVAGAVACGLNGAAAATLSRSDAPRVQAVATAQQRDLDDVAAAIDALPETAQEVKAGKLTEQDYLQEVEAVTTRLNDATVRSASGPAQFTGDVRGLRDVSAAFTRYAALLDTGRATTKTTAAGVESVEAAELRTNRIDTPLQQLRQENAERANGAESSALLSTGLLGLTSLATLVALLGGSYWMASRTKRVVNPGLVGALVTSAAVSAYAFAGRDPGMGVTAGPGTGPLLLVGGLAAAGLVWFGVDQRLKEYR